MLAFWLRSRPVLRPLLSTWQVALLLVALRALVGSTLESVLACPPPELARNLASVILLVLHPDRTWVMVVAMAVPA